jgi:predicted aspartyl protease
MRRLIAFAGLVGSLVLVGFTGWGDASVGGAHAASTVPLRVIKARDGETLAFATVIIHGRRFPFLIDTGSSKTLVDDALARQLHLKTVGRPIKVTGVGCSEGARKVRLSNWSIGGQALPGIVATSSIIAGTNGHAFGLLGSDVMSRFGTMSLDYAHGQLTLG